MRAQQRSNHRVVIIVLGVALIARLGMGVWSIAQPERFNQYPDADRYIDVARHIAAGDGPIRTADDRTGTDPLYPALLAPAWLPSDAGVATVAHWGRIVNFALGMIAVAVLLRLGREVGGVATMAVAGLIFAIDPVTLFFHGLVLTEIAFVALYWGATCLLLIAARSMRLHYAVAAGVLLGLAILTRSSSLYLALMLPAVLIVSSHGAFTQRASRAAAVGASMLIVLAPHAWRHHAILGHWTIARTGGGASLLESWGPWADGGPGMQKIDYPATPPDANELERDRAYRDAAVDWARAHPRRVAELAWTKLLRTWSPAPHAPGYTGMLFGVVGWMSAAPVYALALIGCWHLRRRPVVLALLLAPAAYFSVVHMVFVGSVRYRVPMMPGLFVLCGVALSPWVGRRLGWPVDAPLPQRGEKSESAVPS